MNPRHTHDSQAGGVNVSTAVLKDRRGAAKVGRSVPASPACSVFRAFWPITDDEAGLGALINQARADLPWLTAQAHAVIKGSGKWTVKDSVDVPGSGRVTDLVLIYEAPAVAGRSPFVDSIEGAA